MRGLSIVVGLVAILCWGCAEQTLEEINWHQQGVLSSRDFIPAFINFPNSDMHPVTAYIQDGFVKFQGDIILADTSSNPQATYTAKLWKNHTIPYIIHPDISKKVKKHILKAVHTYTKETSLKWIERTNEEDYVEFKPSSICASYVGRKGGKQPILLADYCSYSAVLHEMGHTLGFQHEQTRPDRDRAVTIHWENIPVLWQSQYKVIDTVQTYYSYDYYSIMHYPAYFGRKLAIEPKKAHINPKALGYRKKLSRRDILGITLLYPLDFQ